MDCNHEEDMYVEDCKLYFPDAKLGSEKYYAFDWGPFLTEENDLIGTPTWTIPTGLTKMDEKVLVNETQVKISADVLGDYKITCELTSTETGTSQLHIKIIHLKVIR